ncbi:alpha/beta fold hydrolase, partial [Streptomyces albidoflavus]
GDVLLAVRERRLAEVEVGAGREGVEFGAGPGGHFLDIWTQDRAALPPEIRAAYLSASAAAIPSITADYRATAGIDVTHDTADRDAGRTLSTPVTVLQHDWGAALGYDAAALWRSWAPDLRHRTVTCGHFMAEEEPGMVAEEIRGLLAR